MWDYWVLTFLKFFAREPMDDLKFLSDERYAFLWKSKEKISIYVNSLLHPGFTPNMWIKIPWLFPDFPWLIVKNTHFFNEPHVTYSQKQVMKMKPSR